MKVALVYDRVNKIGGAERVLEALHEIYPASPLFTLVSQKKNAPWSAKFEVKPTFFNRLPFLRSRHEWLAPFAGFAFETLDLSDFDLVISVTSAEAKAVITRPETLHLCYCLTPTRYLWSGVEVYRHQSLAPSVFDALLPPLRQADLTYAARPDGYLSISQAVQKRLQTYYHRPSTVIYPPIDYDFFSALPKPRKTAYFLVVSRLVPYKRVDLAIELTRRLGQPLVVVGTGSEFIRLQRLARGLPVSFTGQINDRRLRALYQGAKAVLFPQEEDFGLVPLEAAATGTPTLALGRGGALETVLPGQTGLFFPEPTVESLQETARLFLSGQVHFSATTCRRQAARFSKRRFKRAFSAKVNLLWRKHQVRMLSSSPAASALASGRSRAIPVPSSS